MSRKNSRSGQVTVSATIGHHGQDHPMPCVTASLYQSLNEYPSVWTMVPDTVFCPPKDSLRSPFARATSTIRMASASYPSPLHSQHIASLHFCFATIHLVLDLPRNHLSLPTQPHTQGTVIMDRVTIDHPMLSDQVLDHPSQGRRELPSSMTRSSIKPHLTLSLSLS